MARGGGDTAGELIEAAPRAAFFSEAVFEVPASQRPAGGGIRHLKPRCSRRPLPLMGPPLLEPPRTLPLLTPPLLTKLMRRS
jgi:hypothetical protein